MQPYQIKIDVEAFTDIQEITTWYNKRVEKLGDRFKKNVKAQINSLKNNAAIYSIRYENVRCMLVKKFPFLVHFVIDENEKTVQIVAVIHTSRNPKIWEQKN